MSFYLVALAIALAALGLLVWFIRREGRASALLGAAEKSAERAREANAIDEDVKRASDDDLNKRLRAARE